jgi:hypothetical protein
MTHSATPPRALLALAEAKVPRYTSYPTAAQFGPLEEAQYRAWLAQGIGAADPLSLYLHVPFCRDLCWYCACHTKPTRSEARLSAYAQALMAEMALLEAALPAHAGVSHLHFGGGTPSILGVTGLAAVDVAPPWPVRPAAGRGGRDRAGPAPDGRGAGGCAGRDRHHPCQPGRAGHRAGDPGPHRPPAAGRTGATGCGAAAGGGHRRHQPGPDVWPAGADGRACRGQRPLRGVTAAWIGSRCSATPMSPG